jgi:hypothetical protein
MSTLEISGGAAGAASAAAAGAGGGNLLLGLVSQLGNGQPGRQPNASRLKLDPLANTQQPPTASLTKRH